MRCRYRMQGTDTQAMKITCGDVFADTVDFVHDEFKGFVAFAQQTNQGLITYLQSGTTINHEQYNIRLVDGGKRLCCHRSIDALLFARDATCIDDHKALLTQLALTVFSVTG